MRRHGMYRVDLEEIKSHISSAIKLLVIHKKACRDGVNGGILLDHVMSLEHGLEFLEIFLEVSTNYGLIKRIRTFASYVKQKLYSLTCHTKDEDFIMNLHHAYADLREEMKNVIIKPESNEYYMIFPKIFGYDFSLTSLFLCKKIEKLLTSDCKTDLITPMVKELKYIKKMLASLLEPFFMYAITVGRSLNDNEEEAKIFATIKAVLDRVASFIYLSFVGNIDDEMVLSLKNGMSNLIIEETQIMKMYLTLHIDSTKNLESHVYMSLRLLKWNKKCYLGMVMSATLEDHFMSIKQGLQILVRILKISRNKDLKLRIQDFISILNQKLYSLSHNQEDENLIVKLEHAYGELREEMKNVVIKPGTNDYDTLYTEIFEDSYCLSRTKDFILEKIVKFVTSSCKAHQIDPMMKELEELGKKLKSLKPLFDYVTHIFFVKEDEEGILIALTTFLDRATCLIYLSFVGNLKEDMLVSVSKNISLLIEETEIKEMSFGLGIILEDDLDFDIDTSLSLLKRQEGYYIGTISEAMLKDHIMSLKHGIEFLKWIPKIYTARDLKRRIILMAGNVKQKLESLTYAEGDESLHMDVNGAYSDLREELKNVIISPKADNYDTLYVDFRGINCILLEKITTLVTSNCKVDQIAPLKKELQDLLKMLTSLKPLSLYVDREIPLLGNVFSTLLTFHRKSTFFIYLSFIGKMDIEMALSVKNDISTTIKEIDVLEMYIMIMKEFLFDNDYIEKNLYFLENLILLLKSNVECSNDTSSKLYEVLIDVHTFLLGLSPDVLSRKKHVLQSSFQAILGHSIPIFCSCYLEDTNADISAKLNSVLDLIKCVKFEAEEIKLYSFPRVDDLGFLEFFSGYLEDLMKNQELSIKKEIDALHFEVHSLLSLAKVRNQEELNETPWADIINMAYQAEYIIDLYLGSSPTDLGLVLSLSKIIQQLENIKIDVHGLSCKSLRAQEVAVTSKPQALGMTTQVSDNDAIVGLQEETRTIMEYLLSGERKLDVISIVGMAGVGKTTLALTLYKTPLLAVHFGILAWCTVSQSYQNMDLLCSILDQVNAPDNSHRSISDEQTLVDHFCRSLKKRRFLIVLDDIWDTTLWNYLKRYLQSGGEGSRILITTRNRDVADQIGNKVNQLHRLSEANSWELFQKKMLEKESLSDDLLNIGKGIVENCKGLPLSIVIIAGILSGIERTENKWNKIAKSVSSIVLADPQGNCKAILELSYNHLGNDLRSCFLYLGSFPEDQEISVNHLIMRWIAEGLVLDSKSDSAEDVAKRYMDDLIVKSLVIPAKERSRGGVKTFRLHDLLLDFCLDKAREMHFFTLFDQRDVLDPRRIIINGPRTKDLHYSCDSIRSMICFDGLEYNMNRIGKCDMVLLRVFEVWSKKFPEISSLVHLRYLALGSYYWEISALPSSISKLQNLQILILRCRYLVKVPDLVWDMVKLRHVHITPEARFQVDSNRLENSSILLENLRSLSIARVSFGDSRWLSKLCGLQRLSCVFVLADVEEDHYVEEGDGLEEVDSDTDEDYDDIDEDYDDIEEVDDSTEVENDIEEDADLEKDYDDIEENDLEEVDDSTEVDNDIEEDAGLENDYDDIEEDDLEEVDDSTKVDNDIEEDADLENDDDLQEVDDFTEVDNDTEEAADLEKYYYYVEEEDDLEEVDNDTEEDADLETDQFRMLSFNSHLTSLKVRNGVNQMFRFIHKFQLPNGLRELTLSTFRLHSNDISNIGRSLPHLEVFKIYRCSLLWPKLKWNVDDKDFPVLKVLKLRDMMVSKWIASENSFPNLEKLWVEKCNYIDKIPLDFGYLLKLQLITVTECAPSVDDSAREIEKLQHDEQNTEMKVHIYPRRG